MEIEVWVECYSEKANVSIWCGIYAESADGNTHTIDPEMLYSTLTESFWENYQEFEAGVAEAKSLEENNADLTYQQALETVFGHFVLSFKINEQEIALDIDTNADSFMYSLLHSL